MDNAVRLKDGWLTYKDNTPINMRYIFRFRRGWFSDNDDSTVALVFENSIDKKVEKWAFDNWEVMEGVNKEIIELLKK